MKISILPLFLISYLWMACESHYQFEVQDTQSMRWFKGNTHTHTTMSDGDSPPEVVAQWYKNHGYQFLVLSDHNLVTSPKTLSYLVDSTFLLIPGEEVSSRYGKKPVHVNGLNISSVVKPVADSGLAATLQANVNAVRAVKGVPQINHPNFRWAFNYHELLKVNNDKLLEIFSGHPLVNNFGGGGWPGIEQVWDDLLTAGKRIYGIAVDDAHDFQGEFSSAQANPGRAWVVVKAHQLEAQEIMHNLEKGLFYASTGVVLEDIIISPRRIEVRIHPRGDFKYRTEFIGAGGKILQESAENPAIFELSQREPYVRAKVYDSAGFVAWVQPVFIEEIGK